MATVVVIGAGAGGMAVAARLAAKGHDVTVVERSERVGGKLHTERHDGFAFDVGPSLLTLPAVYRDLFLKTGRPLEDEVDLQETEPGFRYGFADGSVLALPGAGVARTANAIGEQLGAAAGSAWRELMDRAAAIWRLTRTDVLGTALTGPKDLLALSRPADVRTVAPWRSLHSLARAALPDPRLVAVLDRYATYSGSQPHRAPGALVTIPFVEQTFGLWHLGGGLGTLAGALRRRCDLAGVRFELGSAVTRIEHDDARVRAVVTDTGERLAADLVVSAVDARLTEDLLGRRPPRTRPRDRSYSGFAILAAVAGESPELHHHNVWFPAAYGGEFTDLAAGRPVRDPAVYVCRPAGMAPAGDEAWFILVNAPRHGRDPGAFDWSHEAGERYADHVLDVLARRGVDLRGRLRWRQVRTPATLGRVDGTGDGAIYGTASHGALSVLRRARNTDALAGLYRVGGSAHPGGGLPLVGMGAEIVADLVGRADGGADAGASCGR